VSQSIPFGTPPIATEIWLYWTHWENDIFGRGIMALTDGCWGHAGMMIFNPDGTAFVYEAIVADNAIDRRDARARFQSFLAEDPRNRLLLVPLRREVFGYGDDQVAKAVAYADTCVKDVTYSKMQIIGMALAQRLGLTFLAHGGPTKQVCSEFQARCVGGGDDESASPTIIDLRDERHNTYDLVTPNSTSRRAMDLLAGYGEFTQLINPKRSMDFTAAI
jgi:hypothetical protein